jgi:hypothetical protein
MADSGLTEQAVLLAQAQQRLQQEQTIFESQMERERAFRRLQLAVGWVTVVMLPSIAVVCVWIISNHETFPPTMLTAASATLFVDVLGIIGATWRTFSLKNVPDGRIEPVTGAPRLNGVTDRRTPHPGV